MNTNFQKGAEEYLARHIPSLTYLFYLKNDIYDLLNCGHFHAGYNGKIVQGRNGILFEKNYLIGSFGYITSQKLADIALQTAQSLKRLEQLLAKRGVRLILVMAPSKVDFFADDAPWYYTIRAPEVLIGSELAGSAYEKEMQKKGVDFVDCYPEMAKTENREYAFPDRGIHWMMYGAALCLGELAKTLHSADPAQYPLLTITGKKKVFEAKYGESDMADLLNIWPRYSGGKDYFYLAEFKQAPKSNAFTFLGDSFMGALIWNMELSGYSEPSMIYGSENYMPTQQEFLDYLENSKVLILVGNVTKFVQPYFCEMADKLGAYLEKPLPPEQQQ